MVTCSKKNLGHANVFCIVGLLFPPDPCVSFLLQTGLSGNLIVLSVLYKGGLLMGSAHMTVGELSSFLMYAFWVGLSIGGI